MPMGNLIGGVLCEASGAELSGTDGAGLGFGGYSCGCSSLKRRRVVKGPRNFTGNVVKLVNEWI